MSVSDIVMLTDGNRYDYSDLCATSNLTIFNEFKDISPKDAHINYL